MCHWHENEDEEEGGGEGRQKRRRRRVVAASRVRRRRRRPVLGARLQLQHRMHQTGQEQVEIHSTCSIIWYVSASQTTISKYTRDSSRILVSNWWGIKSMWCCKIIVSLVFSTKWHFVCNWSKRRNKKLTNLGLSSKSQTYDIQISVTCFNSFGEVESGGLMMGLIIHTIDTIDTNHTNDTNLMIGLPVGLSQHLFSQSRPFSPGAWVPKVFKTQFGWEYAMFVNIATCFIYSNNAIAEHN